MKRTFIITCFTILSVAFVSCEDDGYDSSYSESYARGIYLLDPADTILEISFPQLLGASDAPPVIRPNGRSARWYITTVTHETIMYIKTNKGMDTLIVQAINDLSYNSYGGVEFKKESPRIVYHSFDTVYIKPCYQKYGPSSSYSFYIGDTLCFRLN